jgi:hypothetical protein
VPAGYGAAALGVLVFLDCREAPSSLNPARLAFELEALLVPANSMFILHGDESALERARTAIHQRLNAGTTTEYLTPNAVGGASPGPGGVWGRVSSGPY